MKIKCIIFLLIVFACNKKEDHKIVDIKCDEAVCLQLRNHNSSDKTFDIYMLNSKPIAGFQCDFSSIDITGTDGGLLKDSGYQTTTNGARVLSFSMQAKQIEIGEGILTTIMYSGDPEEICMSEIIFAGVDAKKLSNNSPACISLK